MDMISEHILPPYSGVNPWSKYVPMPPRPKGPPRLSLTHLWRSGSGMEQAIPKKSLPSQEPRGEFVGPETFTRCASDCLTGGREQTI